MECANLVQHANLTIQFWLSLRTMAWPHLLYLHLMLLSLVTKEGCQVYNHLRHLLLNYQVTTSFSTLMQKLAQKIHPNKLILHQIPSQPPQSLYMTKLLKVLFFFGTIYFSPHFQEKYIIHTIYSPLFTCNSVELDSLFRGCCDNR